ncbi:unnamed protein product [Acanthoscelides obtectus]|uniref:Uncharacterized protein n=1 Tax=Acanthoscelides obtectus TaxID=200917 RepID=A0A9P0PKG2_ACAOB|nr:unnamed protein product [Acanthoscelides obtectus]CAK1626484.1 hypothetical protein AOBTE_LOCUS3874 [Acanthoscelides obtectus]
MFQAREISKSIYFSKWYKYSPLAKPVLIIIGRTARLSKIVPCGIWELNLETGLMVVRGIVSYAMFLRTADSLSNGQNN